MARIYVDFGGLQELQNKMSRILNEANDLENEITRSANRLDWEVSQKRSINEQIHGARRKAARLAQKAEQMQRFLVRGNAEFSRTDLKCAKEQQKITYNLESVWKNFLGFYSRTFSEIGQYGAEVLEALKNAGYYFLNEVVDFKKAHLGSINTAVGMGSIGIAPIAPFVVSGALKERIGAVCGGGSKTRESATTKRDTGLLNWINDNYLGGPLNNINDEYGPIAATGVAVTGAFAAAGAMAGAAVAGSSAAFVSGVSTAGEIVATGTAAAETMALKGWSKAVFYLGERGAGAAANVAKTAIFNAMCDYIEGKKTAAGDWGFNLGTAALWGYRLNTPVLDFNIERSMAKREAAQKHWWIEAFPD